MSDETQDFINDLHDGKIELPDVVDPQSETKVSDDLIKNSNGPIVNVENVVRIIRNSGEFSAHFRFNAFTWEPETDILTHKWGPITTGEILHCVRRISETVPKFEKVGSAMVKEALVSYAREHEVNPPVDYFKSCKWDGTKRLDTWLCKVFGVEESELNAAIGSNWLKAMVRRAVEPGYKFDEVLVLEGPQRWKKTTALYTLCSPWFVETIATPNEKDFLMILVSNLVVEFSEGSTLTRGDVLELKSIITRLEDKYRPPYEPAIMRFPRRCVFAMTINETGYLKDMTGNRRWMPVQLEHEADIEWLKENRDQLFAEAYQRAVILKESTWEYPLDKLEELQDSRMVEMPYREALIDWFCGLTHLERENGILIEEVYKKVWLEDQRGQPLKGFEGNIIAGYLKKYLFLENQQKQIDGKRKMRWFMSKKTETFLEENTVSQEDDFDVNTINFDKD